MQKKIYVLLVLLLIHGTCKGGPRKSAREQKVLSNPGTLTGITSSTTTAPLTQKAQQKVSSTPGTPTGTTSSTTTAPSTNMTLAQALTGGNCSTTVVPPPPSSSFSPSPTPTPASEETQSEKVLPRYLAETLNPLFNSENHPRLILGTRSSSYGDTTKGQENAQKILHGCLKPRAQDVTADAEAWIGAVTHKAHLKGDAFSAEFVQKEILGLYKENHFGAIVCERLSLPLDWTNYVQMYKASVQPSELVSSVYVIQKKIQGRDELVGYQVNADNIFSREYIDEILKRRDVYTANIENPVLKTYLKLLAPGGTFYYLSCSNILNKHGGCAAWDRNIENKMHILFDNNYDDPNMQAVYRCIFERAGFTDVQFHQDPDFKNNIVFLTARKPQS